MKTLALIFVGHKLILQKQRQPHPSQNEQQPLGQVPIPWLDKITVETSIEEPTPQKENILNLISVQEIREIYRRVQDSRRDNYGKGENSKTKNADKERRIMLQRRTPLKKV